MKRAIFVILMLTLAASSALAMPIFGAKLGLNLANVTTDPTPTGWEYGMRTGLIIGGTADFMLPNPQMSIRGELAYAMKGSEVTFTGGDATMKLDEVVLAPFFVYRFASESFVPFLQIGPELGFVMSHEMESSGTTTDIADYASTNFSLNIGAGVAKAMGKGEGTLDLRYNLGLSNMYTGSASYTSKTNGIQLLFGYNFNVPTK